jgi:hypothetical protein
MEEVEQKDEKLIEGSELILAAPKTKKENKDLAEREQNGHDRGIVRAFGPTVFEGFRGIDSEMEYQEPNGPTHIRSTTSEERAEQYGVKVGDQVEFNRYDGKIPRETDYANFRIIQDEHIIGVYDE